jgi:hypothetical protein
MDNEVVTVWYSLLFVVVLFVACMLCDVRISDRNVLHIAGVLLNCLYIPTISVTTKTYDDVLYTYLTSVLLHRKFLVIKLFQLFSCTTFEMRAGAAVKVLSASV